MKYRKLRIAWSAGWGILCVLLICLWIRSYGHWDSASKTTASGAYLSFRTAYGTFAVIRSTDPSFQSGSAAWEIEHGEWGESIGQNIDGAIAVPWLPQYEGDDFTALLIIPFWTFAVAFVLCGAVPWIPWRFRLRTLLIGVTLFAVVLGAIVWAAK